MPEEIPFRHRRPFEFQIAGNIFQKERHADVVLNDPCLFRDMIGHVFCVGQRKQIVHLVRAEFAPAEMVRQPGRLRFFDELFQFFQIFKIERVRAADRQGNTVLNDGISFQKLIEIIERFPPLDHEILGNDLEPPDVGRCRQNLPVMGDPKPQSDAQVGQVKYFPDFWNAFTYIPPRQSGRLAAARAFAFVVAFAFILPVNLASALALAFVHPFASVLLHHVLLGGGRSGRRRRSRFLTGRRLSAPDLR